ncbi:hypothetical protein [Paenibacillus daejeonensis]|uniref:hypothetical protein n=1 Tax=Paenibacillus daejeonensis TaxID=135193 RepID=UPI00036669C5|nr:hypothetical protein [Paenibacillus daejeonensis]
MDERFEARLDSQEAMMICHALRSKATDLDDNPQAAFYNNLADRLESVRVSYQESHYERMAERYGLPPIDKRLMMAGGIPAET